MGILSLFIFTTMKTIQHYRETQFYLFPKRAYQVGNIIFPLQLIKIPFERETLTNNNFNFIYVF